jgi:hypothetical protein
MHSCPQVDTVVHRLGLIAPAKAPFRAPRLERTAGRAFRTYHGHSGNMRFHVRKTLRLGPVRIHLTERGFSSWGLKLGRWSWNARSRRHTIDTPGPGYLRSRGRRR